jgi:muramoyltetrapeptide carboxypeptidase LdcA involved in peptidoglycan recycling
MNKIYPDKLKTGDEVRVIAPAMSYSIFSEELKNIANKRFEDLGLKLTFGKHINERNDFTSSSIESRIEDLHDAFQDKNVKAIFTAIGGANSNQLLKYIDWELIKNNPKIFCGFSDITALNNSIFAKTGLVTYSGPHYSTLGQKLYIDYTLYYLKMCLMNNDAVEVKPSESWSDDQWYKDQDKRNLTKNEGWLVINEGKASGTIIGGNLCTFNLLQGAEYMPDLDNSVLFLEDDYLTNPDTFDRDLQSLIHQPDFNKVKGIVIGRFQNKSNVTNELLIQIIKTKKELNNIPVIANVDFGHTDPKVTLSIGGTVELDVNSRNSKITIIEH